MDHKEAVRLVEFNAWANRKVLARAARLPEAELRRPASLSYPSPLATLVHILDAQWYWREAAESGRVPLATLVPADFPNLKALRARWQEEDHLLLGFVRGMPDGRVSKSVTYTWPRARPRRKRLSDIIMHIVTHATQHRSELALFLTQHGQSPGSMDFIGYVARYDR